MGKKARAPLEVRRLPAVGDMTGDQYLDTLRKQDQVFTVKFRAVMYAEPTSPTPPKVVVSTETIGGTVARNTTLTQGVPDQAMKVPVSRVTEIEATKPTEGQLIAFPEREGQKFAPNFGGPRGIMDRQVRRVAKAIRHRLYRENLLGLMKYYVGENGRDLPLNGAKISAPPWLQVINIGFGKTARVWQVREVAEDIIGTVKVTINSAAPVGREEIYEILHALEGQGFGPTEHGQFLVTGVMP